MTPASDQRVVSYLKRKKGPEHRKGHLFPYFDDSNWFN